MIKKSDRAKYFVLKTGFTKTKRKYGHGGKMCK